MQTLNSNILHALTHSPALAAQSSVEEKFFVYANTKARNGNGDPIQDSLIGSLGVGGSGFHTAEAAEKFAVSMRGQFPEWSYTVVQRRSVAAHTFSALEA